MIHGLRFYRASVRVEKGNGAPIFIHSRLDERRSDFDFIFAPLYPLLQNLVYIEQNGEPFVCDEDEYWALALQVSERKVGFEQTDKSGVMPASALERFGRYVSDDWNSAMLFHAGALEMSEMLKVGEAVMFRDEHAAFEECHAAALYFHNWDGVYWEIFCKDATLIEHLVAAHRNEERLRMYKVDFRLDYPNPRNVPLEAA